MGPIDEGSPRPRSSPAVRMFAEIERVFGVKLPLTTLYKTPTIEKLPPVIRGETSTSGGSPLMAIQPEDSRPPRFCFYRDLGSVLI
jgi:phthiocerol/phenolphthiocerol synthesis type-I polyketide synthase E